MEIKGKIIAVMDEKSGKSERTGNEWKSRAFVITEEKTDENPYPSSICFKIYGKNYDKLNEALEIGKTYVVQFDTEAHEYNGNWYNDIKGYDVKPVIDGAEPQNIASNATDGVNPKDYTETTPEAATAQKNDPFGGNPADDEDNLPF